MVVYQAGLGFNSTLANPGGFTNVPITVTHAVPVGGLVIVRGGLQSQVGAWASCADLRGNLYTRIVTGPIGLNTIGNPSGYGNAVIFASLLTTALQVGDTITAHATGTDAGAPDNGSAITDWFSGASADSYGSNAANNAGGGGPASVTMSAPAAAGDLVIGCATADGHSALTDPGAPWASLPQVVGGGVGIAGSYQVPASVGAVTYTENALDTACVIAAFRAKRAAAGGMLL